jgi:hypothetical protein
MYACCFSKLNLTIFFTFLLLENGVCIYLVMWGIRENTVYILKIWKFFEHQNMSGRLWEGSWRFTPDVVFNLIITSNAMFSVTWPAVN